MSLISDALKRARQEAARQDSLRQGVPYAMGVADPPVRRTPWISLLAGLGAGCILAAAVFALAFFAGWGPSRKPAVETRTAEVPAAAVPPSPSAAPVAAPVVEPAALPIVPPQDKTAPAPPPKPVPEPPRVTEERRPTPQQIEITPPAVRRPPPETVPAAPVVAPAPAAEERPAPPPAAPTSAAPAENSGLVEGQAYTGEVPVPGGGSLKLNGIVFSQDHPIAVLDGRVMGPGESVQGFTVVAIESGRVKLQGHGATVFLSPK